MILVECRYTAGTDAEDLPDVPRWVDPERGIVYEDALGVRYAATMRHVPKDGVFATGFGSVLTPVENGTVHVPSKALDPQVGGGQKFDGDKDEPSLLMQGCALAVRGVIAVLGFGFKKYGKRNGWKEVPEAPRRYKDALYRHLSAIERGELVDPESGKPHIDHVACNALFLSQMHHEAKQ